MKKLAFAVLAIGAMAACTKVSVQHEQPSEISLQPVAAMATKAVVSGTEYTGGDFNVWAWWDDVKITDPATESNLYAGYATTPYINAGKFVNRSGHNWGGETPYYWPHNGFLVFAGYSPAAATNTATSLAYDIVNQEFTAVGYTQSNEIDNMKDLMWFDVDKSYNANPGTSVDAKGVPVVFHHALSWLTFKFKLKENITSTSWIIKSVKLTNIELTADFTSKPVSTSPCWSNHLPGSRGYIMIYENSSNTTPVAYDPDKGQLLTNQVDGVVVIPQLCDIEPDSVENPDSKLEITYDLKSPAGPILENQTVTLPLTTTNGTGDTSDDNNWLPGKHYTYTIIFGGNEILIYPTVYPWDNVPETINVGNN